MEVILAWGSRTRHIFVNGALLCEKKPKTTDGYSRKGGHYMSFQLQMPRVLKTHPDEKYTHTDGIIPALPLDQIKIKGIGLCRRTICAVCQKRYDKIFTLQNKEP